ncbi:MAG: hypothetical protein WBH77_10090 [Saccharofermentanales bacterium]
MITILFYISLLSVAVLIYLRMKQEVRIENMLLQEMLELQQELDDYHSQDYLLRQNQIRKSDIRKYKLNKSKVINYRKYAKPETISRIEFAKGSVQGLIQDSLVDSLQGSLQDSVRNSVHDSVRNSVKGSAFYLEEIDKIA